MQGDTSEARTGFLGLGVLLELLPPDIPVQEPRSVLAKPAEQLVLIHLLQPLRALCRQGVLVLDGVLFRHLFVVRLVMLKCLSLGQRKPQLSQAALAVLFALGRAELDEVMG